MKYLAACALTFLLFISTTQGSEPALSPEMLLPSNNRHAHRPAAAFGEGQYLVAWQASRNESADILAVRLDSSGRLLDKRPIMISDARDCQEAVELAFGKGVFLAVWADLRNERDYDVLAARITPEGEVLEPQGILVSGGAHNQCRPAVTFDGNNFFVTWQDFRKGADVAGGALYRGGRTYEIYGARLTREGKVLDPQGLPILTGATYLNPALATGPGGNILLACEALREKSAAVMINNGHVQGEQQRLRTDRHGVLNPTVASSGRGYLVAWHTNKPVGRGRGFFGQAAAVFDGAGIRVKVLESIDGSGPRTLLCNPDATWDGNAYVLAFQRREWDERRPWEALWISRISSAGELLAGKIPLAGTQASPARMAAVASDGRGTTLVAYERHPKTAEEYIQVGIRLLKAN